MDEQLAKLTNICNLVNSVAPGITFTILEIGALPIEEAKEPFYHLVNLFPGSKIAAFEVDKQLCEDLNNKSAAGIEYFPFAVGREDKEYPFYITNHPMCCSLYKPNEDLMQKYNYLEVAMLKSVDTINTITLDTFIKDKDFDSVDFIKIDIQGAELDVFQGGLKTLSDTVFIVSEVEFIPLYLDQPLFGDVCKFLTSIGLMFHKFLGIAGRTLRPIIMNDNLGFASQHMWSDAIFIKDIQKLSDISPEKTLKMGILAYIYGSPDLTYFCFERYDEQHNTNLHQQILKI